ncbi:pantoate--beta-alanine ligase [Candidatus Marinamargulisbacteria bacterium SCGC AG-343-D04]|nr:pantoate--beta-alanine ligase [Candidatus Marinamargulisbacteria bacterium SCGC AG-343-D04]
MRVFSDVSSLQQSILQLKDNQKKIAFVPTMGALHKGHLSLIKTAKLHADTVIVSIFVNNTQFAPHEDFNSYPRNLDSDLQACKDAEVDLVFTPESSTIYPQLDDYTHIIPTRLAHSFCGKSRPQFFGGILSVLVRLFNIVTPDIAVFGEKDYQQFRVITQCCKDLFIPTTIIMSPLIREQNGLAMSSRNQYLTSEQRETASSIFKALQQAQLAFRQGEHLSSTLLALIRTHIDPSITHDYLHIVHSQTLKDVQHCDENSRILFAGFLDKVRLIDTMSLFSS